MSLLVHGDILDLSPIEIGEFNLDTPTSAKDLTVDQVPGASSVGASLSAGVGVAGCPADWDRFDPGMDIEIDTAIVGGGSGTVDLWLV